MYGSFSIFFGEELNDYLRKNDKKIITHIEIESEDYILNINETDYLNYLFKKFNVELPLIYFDGITAESIEKEIPVDYFHDSFRLHSRRESCKRPVLIYYVPFEGNSELFRYRPNPFTMRTEEVYITDKCICFEVIDFDGDAEKINNQASSIVSLIKKQSTHFTNQLETYNNQLPSKIKSYFDARKQKILKKKEMLAALDVPLRKNETSNGTYVIPPPGKRKKINIKPKATEKEYKPEPSIDNSIYYEILKVIYNIGKSFEMYPSIYKNNDKNKGEENLRDLILLSIQPHFEGGSATGETFNKSGKTDISIRYENSVVFIAECKFWRGKQSYLEAISQLLGYLTWRNSKAAIIIFVDNKNISSVLETVKEVTPDHSNYLGFVKNETESWFNYRFHINDDPNREIKLAVLLFHIPNS